MGGRARVASLIADIQRAITRQNFESALPILKWTKDKIELNHTEKVRAARHAHSKSNGDRPITNKPRRVKRGTIYYASLGKNIGSEQNGHRPVIVVQNRKANETSPTVVVIPLTDLYDNHGNQKRVYDTHVVVNHPNLTKPSLAKTEYVRTISKNRLKEEVGDLDSTTMSDITDKLKITLEIT